MGGKPSKGTPPDGRLAANKSAKSAAKPATPARPIGRGPTFPAKPTPKGARGKR